YRMIDFYGYDYHQFLYYPRLRLHHDYNSSLKQLASKETRNLINGRNIDLQYPQLVAMKRQFNELSKKSLRHPNKRDAPGIAQTIKKTREAFHKDVDEVAIKTMERRWRSPDSPE